MIINNAPKNEAVLSNVGEIGEFRIRNSAKAFNILSSGLYANKIRAIIRELSCNAVDSHTAAGKSDTPFDIHLPTQLEPWFSIRDYGTGLSNDQVTNIYTTYFESTKTESNDFIGALGLGSKSPFSYTDNFTVTAIKNGIKGIYSAFINEAGVPSIAQMMNEETSEPAGVEVKFSVNDRWDFSRFQEEARIVYRYFKLRPVVSGPDFVFDDAQYESKDIIPGVHALERGSSRAIMGNIAYPIEVPNAETALGDLYQLLQCRLELNFEIGELDFQASREGLSYIPETIASIKRKLEAVNDALAVVLAKEADECASDWDRAEFLYNKAQTTLWSAAVTKYVTDTKFEMLDVSNRYVRRHEFKVPVKDLAKKYNITINAFSKSRGNPVCSTVKANNVYDNTTKEHGYQWYVPVSPRTYFVTNDTKIGALERAKFHWRNGGMPDGKSHCDTVMVLGAADKTKPVKYNAFLKSLKVPANQILVASSLKEKPRTGSNGSGLAKNVSIMKLGQRGYGGYYKEREMVWKDAGKASEFDANTTYFYLPLKGFEIQHNGAYIGDVKRFLNDITSAGIGMGDVTIYGVRKSDHKWVSGQKNWVNIQDHLVQKFSNINSTELRKLIAKELDMKKYFRYNNAIASKVDSTSQYLKFVDEFKDPSEVCFSRDSFMRLARDYKGTVDVDQIVNSIQDELTAVKNRYPLLSSLKDYDVDYDAVAQYINMIDKEVK